MPFYGHGFRRAKDLRRGLVMRLHVYGEVIALTPAANGKRTKVTIALEDQSTRKMSGGLIEHRGPNALEFTDGGYVLQFLCNPSRSFHVYGDSDDGNDNDDYEPGLEFRPLEPV